ncbi:MAG: DUF1572 domain-containing protein [Pseudomonadales bacterium]|nr:DUF1572 domain-containing protein [Pseudomonadales bacterium]
MTKLTIESPQWVIESIDRELAHYRKRVGQIFFFGFILEVLILGGKEKILLDGVGVIETATIYTILFVAIPVIVVVFGREYLNRIHILKESRNLFLEKFNLSNVFPTSKHHRLNEIHTMSVVLTSLSLAGILVFWINALNPIIESCPKKTSYSKSMHATAGASAD